MASVNGESRPDRFSIYLRCYEIYAPVNRLRYLRSPFGRRPRCHARAGVERRSPGTLHRAPDRRRFHRRPAPGVLPQGISHRKCRDIVHRRRPGCSTQTAMPPQLRTSSTHMPNGPIHRRSTRSHTQDSRVFGFPASSFEIRPDRDPVQDAQPSRHQIPVSIRCRRENFIREKPDSRRVNGMVMRKPSECSVRSR